MVKTQLRVVVGLLAATLVVLGLGPAAQAYPEVIFKAEVSEQVVFAGQSFQASSEANVTCQWTHEWNGVSNTSSGTEFTSTFTAPPVEEETVIPVHFTCEYSVGASAGTAAVRAATWTRSVDVTVLPAGAPVQSGDEGAAGAPGVGGQADADVAGMPNTGGPNVLFLVAGLLLLLAGAVAVRLARGRALDADTGPAHS